MGMSTNTQPRQPKGTPVGGQFAGKTNPEPGADILEMAHPVKVTSKKGTTVIHIDGAPLLAVLDAGGWTRFSEKYDGKTTADQAIRLCAPTPGDASLIGAVEARRTHGPRWHDDPATTEADVREWLGNGLTVTDADLEETFGPQWKAVTTIVRRSAVLSRTDVEHLRAARSASLDALPRITAQRIVWKSAWDAAGDAAYAATRESALSSAWDALPTDTEDPSAAVAAMDAITATVTWDLATRNSTYTIVQRDLLIAPWERVFGLPEGLG